MADPTLVSSDTAWGGWTVSQVLDEILRPFGLTNDTTTSRDRVEATTDEATLALDVLRLATTYLFSKYPNVWSARYYTGTWVGGDKRVMVPANCKFIQRVLFKNVPLNPISLEDRTRYTRDDDQGGDWQSDASRPSYYFLAGIADADLGANGGGDTGTPDYRQVLELVPAPADSDAYAIWYVAKSPAYGAATSPIEVDQLYQDWLVQRGVMIMAGKMGGAAGIRDSAMMEAARVEEDIWNHLEGTGEFPDRVRWDYPPLADSRSGNRGGSNTEFAR